MTQKKKNILFALYLAVVVTIGGYVLMGKLKNQETPRAAASALDNSIEIREQALSTGPENPTVMLSLAQDYIQKARETADTSYYTKIDGLMDRAKKISPDNPDVEAIEATVAVARHQFTKALALAEKIVAKNPDKAIYYGILVDAQTELGKNAEAITSLQTMVNLRPDYSSYSRIAYARELYGDIDGAKETIQLAQAAGAAFPENTAWGFVELGKLEFRTNNTGAAEEAFRRALETVPNYPPALEQLGRMAFARGDTAGAISYFEQAFQKLPVATYVTALGEVYAAMGDKEKAAQQYAIAKLAFDKSAQNGVNTDMELSLFLSEHDLELPRSLELALASYAVRPSIYGADALAWAYYKNGQIDKALTYAQQALRLGEHDPLLVYHASVIAQAAGDSSKADRLRSKAYALHPNFSMLYAKPN